MKTNLPKRFWLESDYAPGEERFKKRVISINTKDLKKIYNKTVNPFLKSLGFKYSGMKAILENQNFSFMVYFGARRGGTGQLVILAHPNGYPSKEHHEFKQKELHHYLFSRVLALSNGNTWIDLGLNEEEGKETCELLLELLKDQLQQYIERFEQFDQKIEKITTQNLEKGKQVLIQDLGLSTAHQDIDASIALWLSRFHDRNGSKSEAKNLANHVIELEKNSNSKLSILASNILESKPYHWTKENNDKFWNN